MAHPFTRRDFVRTAAASTAAITAFGAAAPAAHAKPTVLAAPRPRGTRANDRMQLAFIGFGVRARELHGGFLDDAGIEIVAVADVVAARAQEGARLINERRKNGACKVAGSWREILANPAIDAVIIATPDHWHAEPAIAAALAGKHVYCEKPLSLTIAEGRAIANAARATQIRFQTGSQQRSEFGYHFVRAAEAVRNGRIGKVTRVTIGVGAPPVPCDLPEQPLPEGIDWDGWLGQAPFRPFNAELCPIGMHGHAAGVNFGMWDQQNGVAGTGDLALVEDTAFSIELNVRTTVPEWGNQDVRIPLEQDILYRKAGPSWLDKRQTALIVIK